MTRLLAIDTSTWWASAALVETSDADDGCRIVAQKGRRVEDSHAARLIPLVDELLAEAGWRRQSIDAYAAVRGPGSFTGLRVGLGVLRGLSLASGRPCLGIGTLEAAAETFGIWPLRRAPMFDAGRGEVFAALYDADASPPEEIVAPWLAGPEESADRIGAGAVVFGPGAEHHAARLASLGMTVVAGRAGQGVASGAGRIAWSRLRTGACDGEGMEPMYLRPADAELGRGR